MKALLFDFDGVILESADIKVVAYQRLFEKEYPDKVDEFIKYHIKNAGISRYVKIQYFYEVILGTKVNAEKKKELINNFSRMVLKETLNASFVKGMPEFLIKNYKKLPMFIVTGTPDKEINYIVRKRKLDVYFKEVHGSPNEKREIISDILNRYKWDPKEVIFIGDAESDLQASEETGVVFVARLNCTSTAMENCKYKIRDFNNFEIEDMLRRGGKV